jgi:ABC-type dipeptide/oligopeptide/nickel transport system permease subunit
MMTMGQAPWLTVSPGVVILLVILAFNVFGDVLRDVLDPKLRGTRQWCLAAITLGAGP